MTESVSPNPTKRFPSEAANELSLLPLREKARMRGVPFGALTSFLSRQRLCRKCHSEAQPKNLVFVTSEKCEMLRGIYPELRRRAQHDISALSRIATQPLKGDDANSSPPVRNPPNVAFAGPARPRAFFDSWHGESNVGLGLVGASLR
jgi:hypothetical protein